MHIETSIDDQLFQQAAHLTGLADKRALLEEGLRSLIQSTKKVPQPTNFWDALQRFRAEVNLEALDIDTSLFDSDRKQQTEREIDL